MRNAVDNCVHLRHTLALAGLALRSSTVLPLRVCASADTACDAGSRCWLCRPAAHQANSQHSCSGRMDQSVRQVSLHIAAPLVAIATNSHFSRATGTSMEQHAGARLKNVPAGGLSASKWCSSPSKRGLPARCGCAACAPSAGAASNCASLCAPSSLAVTAACSGIACGRRGLRLGEGGMSCAVLLAVCAAPVFALAAESLVDTKDA